jgi:ribokinase
MCWALRSSEAARSRRRNIRGMGRIAVVGSNMMDLVTYVTRFPAAGETIEAPSFQMAHGGKGANQAVAAARLGSEVLFVGNVGDDAFGALTLENFRKNGIDVHHVGVVADCPSGVAPIFVEPNGENRILIVLGANARLTPADVERARPELRRADVILLQLEVPLETVYATLALGVECDIPVFLNPAPATPALDLERLRGLKFLVPNQTELALLSGLPATTIAEAEIAARSVIAAGVAAVIVTLGADGALYVTADERVHVAAPDVTPVDTTGAGDAFIGSFAHSYSGTHDVTSALHLAVVYAADSVTRRGAQMSYATHAEFETFQLATKDN